MHTSPDIFSFPAFLIQNFSRRHILAEAKDQFTLSPRLNSVRRRPFRRYCRDQLLVPARPGIWSAARNTKCRKFARSAWPHAYSDWKFPEILPELFGNFASPQQFFEKLWRLFLAKANVVLAIHFGFYVGFCRKPRRIKKAVSISIIWCLGKFHIF